MSTPRAYFVAALAAFAFGSGAPAAAQAPDSLQHALVSAVDSAVKAVGAPGAQVLVMRKGRILLDRGFGVRNLADNTPVDAQTRFEIGSITKQFTAAAILQLKERGKLSLDDTLGKFVPEYPTGAAITLRQLLWQVSGIPNYTAVNGFLEYSTTHPGGVEGILALIGDKPLEFTPGTKWEYSNSNYALLGRVVEVASGMPWERYIREQIFVPAGMTHSTFNDQEAGVADMATGYTKQNGTLAPPPDMGNWPVGAGAIVSTVGDLSKWDDAFFGGRLASPEDVKVATTPGTLADGGSTGYGFGWMMDKHAGQARTWHNGGTFGFASMNEEFPSLNQRIIVLVNDAAGGAGGIADAALAALNPDLDVGEVTALPGEDPAITKLAQEWWSEFLGGKIDRSRLTPAMDKALTPEVLAQSRQHIAPLGTPTAWIYRGSRKAGTLTAYLYHLTFSDGQTLNLTMAVTADGKLAGYRLLPG